MQGAFNVDWDQVLDDDELDEETSRLYRQKVDELEVAGRSAAAQRGRRGRPGRGRGRGGGLVPREGPEQQGPGKERQAIDSDDDKPVIKMDMPRRRGEDEDEDDDEDEEEDEDGDDDENEGEEEEEEEEDDDNGEDDEIDDAAGGGAGGDPAPARAPAHRRRKKKEPVKIPVPHPPAQRFTSEGKQFFVVQGEDKPRAGLFGHYLKAYTVDDDEECVPFPPPQGYDPNKEKVWEEIFIDAGWPGQPWPSLDLIKEVNQFWIDRDEPWIPQTLQPEDAGWSRAQLKAYRRASNKKPRRDALVPFMIERKRYHENRNTANRGMYFHIGPPGFPDPGLPPNVDACKPGVDFIACASPLEEPKYYEVGSEFLKRRVEEGEALDFEFARRMQGLLGVAQDHVWACLDPSFNPADRPAVLERFMASYAGSFYKTVAWQDQQDPRAVATEALQQHKAFCEEWVHRHYRTLTPAITAAAEALVADFYQSVRARMKPQWALSVPRFARLLMRHPSLSQYFGVCLQSYMTSLDQSRPGRNASYKSMNQATVARFQSFKRFVVELRTHGHQLSDLYKALESLEQFHFHPYVVDWYGIAGQLPEAHRYFPRPQDNLLLKRIRNAQGQARAPWLVGRT